MTQTTSIAHSGSNALNLWSDENQIRAYFAQVVNLSNSGEEFPVDLDDVWELAYSRKDNAVRTLENNEFFIEGIDYQFFRKKAEKLDRGRPEVKCKMTVAAMEFFIARRVRPVFEVYRKMFHFTIKKVGRRALMAPDEKKLLGYVQKYYVKGDSLRVAEMTGFSPRHVLDVKNGVYRNQKIIEALVEVTVVNFRTGRIAQNQYGQTQQMSINFEGGVA